MRGWWRRIRGAAGLAVAWATGWGLAGAIYGLGLGLLFPVVGPVISLTLGAQYALAGFVGGAVFSAILRLTEGRRRFDELSLRRFAAWGALGGLVLGAGILAGTGAMAEFLVARAAFVGITTLLGAGSAIGSLAMARSADDRELLREGARTANAGLTQEERRRLLGDHSG